MSDRPLTDAQERALLALADGGVRKPCRNIQTLDALEAKGLVRLGMTPLSVVAQITEKGRALLDSMGD